MTLTRALCGGYVPPVEPTTMHPRRTRPPQHPPHPAVAQLRASGWTLEGIARNIGSSVREVSRWAAGDTRPLGVYERELTRLASTVQAA